MQAAQLRSLPRLLALGALSLVTGLFSSASAPAVHAQAGPLSLGLTASRSTLTPGDTLAVGISVNNPGGGPLADFFFLIVLPDGVTVVSAGPGVGGRVGSTGNLRSLVPVARGVSLASPFPYQSDPFFSYTFTGVEPSGTYRFYLAAVRSGGFDDGAINGGDVLAVASQDITFGASPVVTETARAVTVAVPMAGGVVQTTSGAGAVLSLRVPDGALRAPTSITIAPLAAFAGLPAGPLVAGISAEPSGLHFDTPATLTITLPAGFQAPPFGLRGFIADSHGQNLQAVPVAVSGNVVTLNVPHFSVAGVSLNSDWLEPCDRIKSPAMATACQQVRPLYDAELLRLGSSGGPIGAAFKAAVQPILSTWAQSGIKPRLIDAQMPGAADPNAKPAGALSEWLDWTDLYVPVFDKFQDQNNAAAGNVLGSVIDQVQVEARLTFRAGMNAINGRCLADKANAANHVYNVAILHVFWSLQFGLLNAYADEDVTYCLDIRIDATPPPALTPGQAAPVPIDIRFRFADGTDLPGHDLSVAITATSASVSPAGGILASPVTGDVELTPTAASSLVTITAAAVEPLLEVLPIRRRTFQAGQAAPVTLSLAELESDVSLYLDGMRVVADGQSSVAQPDATSDATISRNLGEVTAAASIHLARQIRLNASGGTAVLTGSTTLTLNQIAVRQALIDLVAALGDGWCMDLPGPFTVRAVVAHGASVSVGDAGRLRSGDSRLLGAGRQCVDYSDQVRRTLTNGAFSGETGATLGYSLTFTPVP